MTDYRLKKDIIAGYHFGGSVINCLIKEGSTFVIEKGWFYKCYAGNGVVLFDRATVENDADLFEKIKYDETE